MKQMRGWLAYIAKQRAAVRLWRGRAARVYHIGTGRSRRVGEGLELLVRLSGRSVQTRVDATVQRGRRVVAQGGRSQSLMHLTIVAQRRGTARADRGVGLDFARVTGIEFAVDKRVQ